MLTKERINNAESGILNLVPCHKLYILDSGTRFMCLFHFVMDLKYGHIIHYKVVPRMSRKLCRSCPVCNYFQLLPLFLFFFCSSWFDSFISMQWSTDFVTIEYNQMRQACSLQAIAGCSETMLCPSSVTTEDNLGSVLSISLNGRRCMRNTNLLPLCSLWASGKGTAALVFSW